MKYPSKQELIITIKILIIKITEEFNYSKIYNYQFLKQYIKITTQNISNKYNINIFKLHIIQEFITHSIENKLKLPISQTDNIIELIHLLQFIVENNIDNIIKLISHTIQ